MVSAALAHAHQSPVALAGTWKLAGGRAMTLQPRQPGVVRVAHGMVWATCDGPHRGPANQQGDRFIGAGEQLLLGAGRRLVIEALDKQSPAYFSWDPVPRQGRQQVGAAALVQPAEDLRLALVRATRAAGRLLAAFAALAGGAVPRRGRPCLAECAFNAHSSA